MQTSRCSCADWTRVSRLAALLALLLLLLAVPAWSSISGLTRIGGYDSTLGEGAAEIAAYDAASQRLFVVNAVEATVDIVSLTNPAAPTLVSTIDVTAFGAGANSVAVANGLVAVAVEADPAQDPGTVAFFDVNGQALGSVTVGALPDMVTFTPDGTTVLVANEGEPSDDYTTDPEGSVSIIDLGAGLGNAAVTTVSFTDFDLGGARAGELPPGVRIFGPGASVAQDLEPEYIAVSADGGTAWVSLQENNAIAVIDVAGASVLRIDALGIKNHSAPGNALDPSNRDDGIAIANWPTFGLYQPDAIATFMVDGVNYVATANEGDARDYEGFSEEERMADLVLDTAVFPNAATLQLDENLGRLKTTSTLGDLDGDGDVDRLYSYGARSFSIWNGTTGAQVYDSGDDFERITADRVPAIFNSDESDPGEFDDRSDDKGPEPEAVVIGRVGSRLYAFVGLERVGGIMIYDVTSPAAPTFVTYEPNTGGDVSPEGLVFIPGADSPSGRPLLVTANEVSGTVGIYEIEGASGTAGSCSDDGMTLCLQAGRFAVTAAWSSATESGSGVPVGQTDNAGSFWFFTPDNTELVVKVLDACVLESRNFWVFASGLTDVGVTLTVTDTVSGASRQYTNGLGQPFQLVRDTGSFEVCDI